MGTKVTDNIAMRRFELPIDGDASAYAYYRIDDGRVVLIHTEVPYEYSGQDVGTILADGVFEEVRRTHRRVTPKCAFMAAYALKHAEFVDIVAW